MGLGPRTYEERDMAVCYSDEVRVYLGGYDVSAALDQSALVMAVAPQRVTGFGEDERVVAGERRDTLDHAGYFADGGGSLDDASKALLGSVTTLALVIGAAQGGVAYATPGAPFPRTYDLFGRFGEMVRAWNRFALGGAFERCLLLQPKVTKPAGFSGASLDEGAASADGGIGYLFCFGADGTAQVDLEDSPDGTAFALLAAFAQLSGITAQRIALSGGVQRFVRARLSLGTATSVTYAVLWGRG